MKKIIQTIQLISIGITSILLTSCGALTGIPGHGGGKRFAIEQEMVAAATRGAIQKVDLHTLKGKRVNLFINAIGDNGAGNIIGGRLSLVSQLRGDYIHTPATTERSVFPFYTTTTKNNSITRNSTGLNSETNRTSGNSTTSSLLNSPEYKRTQQKGGGNEFQLGAKYEGLGAYQNSEEISSDDLQYLFGLLQNFFFLKGVTIVPPSEADVDVYITVDVFGTIRTRVDWFFANNEILRAKTILEVMAVDHLTGELLLAPQAAYCEAEYNEQYVLWAGPVKITKRLKKTSPLLSDFTKLEKKGNSRLPIQKGEILYPFKKETDNQRNK